jgi:hypothetical protein
MGMYVWRIVASPCHAVGMFRKKLYRRTTPDGVETLVVVGSFDADGDSEIRVTHALGEAVVDDRIGFYGPGGEQWLRDRHASWTADGFELVSSGPDFQRLLSVGGSTVSGTPEPQPE